MTTVYHTYYESPIGVLKIAGTDQFITEVSLVDHAADVAVDLENEHPLLLQCIEQLIEYFNGIRKAFDVPVNQEGTDFQKNVWNELLTIPYGKTLSYLDLSKHMGNSKAIRAAAAANGQNKILIIVPCHRVIGTNRSLVGYAAGLPRKKWLLEHEKKVMYGVQTLF